MKDRTIDKINDVFTVLFIGMLASFPFFIINEAKKPRMIQVLDDKGVQTEIDANWLNQDFQSYTEKIISTVILPEIHKENRHCGDDYDFFFKRWYPKYVVVQYQNATETFNAQIVLKNGKTYFTLPKTRLKKVFAKNISSCK